MVDRKNGSYAQTQNVAIFLAIIFCLSVFASSASRGIAHDEGLGGFREGAARIYAHHDLLTQEDIEQGNSAVKFPARLMYLWFIALGYKVFGFSLLALHAVPYVLQILNPSLFFLVVSRFYKSLWWGFAGALLFLLQPVNLIYLNQQHTHPVFVFFLLMILLCYQRSRQNSRWLIGMGIFSAFLVLTRLEDGTIFVSMMYAAYIIEGWGKGLKISWVAISVGSFCVTYAICALWFGFPVFFPLYYVTVALRRNQNFGVDVPFAQATKMALRNITNWYLGGKFAAPVFVALIAVGAVDLLRRRIVLPLALFFPHFLFFVFIFAGRVDIGWSEPLTFSTTGFVILLLSGLQALWQLVRKHIAMPSLQKVVWPVVMCILLALFGRAAYSLAIIAEDSHPSSNMWRFVATNPPLPGHPEFRETRVAFTAEDSMEVPLREELFRAVLGRYRTWYVHQLGKHADKESFPQKVRESADFVYHDDYESNLKWESDRKQLEGTSSLWNEKYAGRIGAFPLGKEGEFVYKFDFTKPVEHVTISDMHTQWGMGDVTKMWTSTDGKQWTLRYNNWNVHYTKDPYHQFFDREFDGQTTLYIKYFFHAGDKTRSGNDNRGASLEEFSLAVTFKDD